MSERKDRIRELCDEAIAKVDAAIRAHKEARPSDLDEACLLQVRSELVQMRDTLDSSKFRPGYGRFLLDWPDEHGLVAYLIDVAYQYKRRT